MPSMSTSLLCFIDLDLESPKQHISPFLRTCPTLHKSSRIFHMHDIMAVLITGISDSLSSQLSI